MPNKIKALALALMTAAALAFASVPLIASAADEFPYSAESLGIIADDSADVDAIEHHPPHLYAPPSEGIFGLGSAASADDIAAWDIDIRYDGVGLPAGDGSAESGEALYDAQCAICHGDFGQGEGRWPVLVGGEESLTHQGDGRPEKTVGSYWPFAATLFDYIRRAMPYNTPQSLSDSETYALVAYILYLNNLVDDDFVADADSIADFPMPNRPNFFPDPRPDTVAEACMSDCLPAEQIALIETIKGVTPEQQLQSTAEQQLGSTTPAPAQSDAKKQDQTSAAASSPPMAAAAYTQFCALCHDSGLAGAPKPGDSADWQQRLSAAGGVDGLIQSAIVGSGAMPPKGGAVNLSDSEIADLVRYMLGE